MTTTFWISAAAIAALTLALLLQPLWARGRRGASSRREINVSVYRDQLRELEADLQAGTLARADYDRARSELEKRLLEDVDGTATEPQAALQEPQAAPRRRNWAVASFAAAIPVLALAVYLAIGTPAALDPHQRQAADVGMKELEGMVQKLADRLAKNPDDVQGWRMLGRSYSVMGRFAEAATALSKAAAQAPRDPQLLADLADALAMARGQSMNGEPEELVLRALQIDPNNLKALALAGTAAFDRKDYASAARHWERMLPLVEAGSEDARTIQANVDEARTLAKQGPQAAAKGPEPKKGAEKNPAETKAAAQAAPLQGKVSLSPKLAAKAKPDDVVFIFARAAEGPPAPLAVLRKTVRDLPFAFSLDDSMAMSPANTLSGAKRVVVGARVAKSGNAAAQPGDLQGLSAPVSSDARGVEVVIDRELPQK